MKNKKNTNRSKTLSPSGRGGEGLLIYFNSRCQTCRTTLGLLQDNNCEIEIVEYLTDIPTEKELKEILKKLGLKAEQIIRKKESLFAEKYKDKKFSDAEWVKILVKNPILIERPIVVKGDKAVLGRPPENVLKLI